MSNECAEEKRQASMWKKIATICGTIIAIAAVGKLWYEVDCYLTVMHGDTVFAKDSDITKERQLTEAELKELRDQMVLMQKLRNAESKIARYKEDYRQNLLFIQQVRERYPMKEDIPGYSQIAPSGLFKEYRDAKKSNDKLEKKIDEWEKERDRLELKGLENGGGS